MTSCPHQPHLTPLSFAPTKLYFVLLLGPSPKTCVHQDPITCHVLARITIFLPIPTLLAHFFSLIIFLSKCHFCRIMKCCEYIVSYYIFSWDSLFHL